MLSLAGILGLHSQNGALILPLQALPRLSRFLTSRDRAMHETTTSFLPSLLLFLGAAVIAVPLFKRSAWAPCSATWPRGRHRPVGLRAVRRLR